MKNILTLAFFLIAVAVSVQAQDMKSFGEKISAEGAKDPASVYDALKDEKSAQIKVKGTILKVCKMKFFPYSFK